VKEEAESGPRGREMVGFTRGIGNSSRGTGDSLRGIGNPSRGTVNASKGIGVSLNEIADSIN
jgi:hypothetical protein